MSEAIKYGFLEKNLIRFERLLMKRGAKIILYVSALSLLLTGATTIFDERHGFEGDYKIDGSTEILTVGNSWFSANKKVEVGNFSVEDINDNQYLVFTNTNGSTSEFKILEKTSFLYVDSNDDVSRVVRIK